MSKAIQQTTSFYSWRAVLIFSALLAKFILAVQPSYIHPDEFFQSFQILYNDNLPWEVKNNSNINRSIVPLLLINYPSIWMGKHFGLTSYQIYLLVRIQLTIISWIITDWCLYRLVPMKHERIKSTLFTMTSYLTLVHQTHTFSNSIETCILLPTLYLINDIRSYLETNSKNNYCLKKLMLLGLLISFGVFNRITFPAWIFLPAFYLFKYFAKHPIRSLIPIFVFSLTSLLIIVIDTSYYQSQNYQIAPLNNLFYNLKSENLSIHGIHPRFTHILINYPQMVGPLIFLIFPFTKNYIKTTTFMATVSGFLILSIFPHQELRFLLPSVPLLSTLISFSNPSFKFLNKYYKIAFSIWLIYTSILSIFYGLFHQAGIIPAINEINSKTFDEPTTLIFWRTYPPPTWMIDKSKFKVPNYISKNDDNSINLDEINCNENYIIDLMGSSIDKLDLVNQKFLSKCSKLNPTYLITPINAIINLERSQYNEIWSTFWHLDMDHFEYDINGLKTFTPGLGLYNLL